VSSKEGESLKEERGIEAAFSETRTRRVDGLDGRLDTRGLASLLA
jgi:hypothetical protein